MFNPFLKLTASHPFSPLQAETVASFLGGEIRIIFRGLWLLVEGFLVKIKGEVFDLVLSDPGGVAKLLTPKLPIILVQWKMGAKRKMSCLSLAIFH